MRTRIVVAVVSLLGVIVGTEPLLACGEKFLMRNRGTRFQRAGIPRPPAAILVYANPALNLPKALANLPVEATLRKAGYRPTTVARPEEFDSAIARGGWDLVLVDVADAAAAIRRAPAKNPPIVLPVVFNATKAELAEAKRQHAHVLRAPTKSQSFLDSIDDLLYRRAGAQTRPGN